MVKSFLEFQSDVEADAGRTILVLTKKGLVVEQLLEFQIAMIACNDIPGVVKLEQKEIDSDVKLCYHLNGLISLGNYLKKQRISKSEFIEILVTIISHLFKCKNYLLNDNSFVLKEEFIYINPRSKQISLIYLPLEIESNSTEEFKSFLINLLINTANIDTEDNFVQLLLNQIKSDHFSLAEFREQLTAITGKGYIPLPSEATPWPISNKEQEEVQLDPVKFPDGGLPKPKMRKALFAILAIISVIYAIISALPVQYQVILSRPDKATAIIFGLIFTSLIAFITVLSLAKKNKAQNFSPVVIDEKAPKSVIDTTLLADQSMETSLLSDCPFPYLKSVLGEEKIIIDKPQFTMGRQKGISDHVIYNKNIGRLHAQISCSDSKYFITDLDSINGTFINGSRILSNKQHSLNHNDKVALANLEYLFICL